GHFCLTLHVAMQLGLYLPGSVSPVWRTVSEDSGQPLALSIAPSCACRLRSWRAPSSGARQSQLWSDGGREPFLARCLRTSRSPPASSTEADYARRRNYSLEERVTVSHDKHLRLDRACCSA